MSQMCPNCGQDNRDQAKYCTHCQTQLQGLLGSHAILQNRYEIMSLLGCGGMGAVYLALDHRLGQNRVAVKENLDTSQQAATQFQQEANVLAQLDHPNLPKVIDHFIEPTGRQYLVMEYIAGDDLATAVKQRGALPEAQVLAWADELLDALIYLHEQPQPILHRDIKPSNVKITPKGKVKLVDFGLVKFYSPANPYTATLVHGRGSPGYAPPEQHNPAGHTDARSDIYALGATLYHLLTGEAPATATDRIANPTGFLLPRHINAAIAPATEAVILRAIELPMSHRFQTAREMRRALHGVQTGTQAQAAVPPVVPPSVQGSLQSPWLWVGMGALFVVGLVCIAAVFFVQRSQATSVQATNTAQAAKNATVAAGATLAAQPTATPAPTELPPAPNETSIPPTEPPAASPTPLSLPTPSPAQAVRDYYVAINQRQYDVTWATLSNRFKDKFNCCAPGGGYDFAAYQDWWNSVTNVEIGQITVIQQSGNMATVSAQLGYLRNGKLIPDDKPTILLVFDEANRVWLFDDKW
jgi:serine/threonine protein kinase